MAFRKTLSNWALNLTYEFVNSWTQKSSRAGPQYHVTLGASKTSNIGNAIAP